MTTLDFSPLFRSTIGFDRLANLVEDALRVDESTPGYPPYNIEKRGEDNYRISLAVAGFGEDDLSIEARENAVLVTGRKKAAENGTAYLHRGIAERDFRRSFRLADFVKVVGATFDHGLLHIDLVREIPEAMKPRRIEINAVAGGESKKAVEDKKQAA